MLTLFSYKKANFVVKLLYCKTFEVQSQLFCHKMTNSTKLWLEKIKNKKTIYYHNISTFLSVCSSSWPVRGSSSSSHRRAAVTQNGGQTALSFSSGLFLFSSSAPDLYQFNPGTHMGQERLRPVLSLHGWVCCRAASALLSNQGTKLYLFISSSSLKHSDDPAVNKQLQQAIYSSINTV